MKRETPIEAYPLTWPYGYARREPHERINSQFSVKPGAAIDGLRNEVYRITKTKDNGLVISTNIRPDRKDGSIYAEEADRKIDEPGVAIYFNLKGKQVALCNDQYLTPAENIWALAKTLNAIRAIERYGTSDFLSRAFTGFNALPAPIIPKASCWYVLGISTTTDKDVIKSAWTKKAKKVHPDKGGSTAAMQELNEAYEEALRYAEQNGL